jgi:hypothetical protein
MIKRPNLGIHDIKEGTEINLKAYKTYSLKL